MCLQRLVTCSTLIVKEYFEDLRLGLSQSSCLIVLAPRLFPQPQLWHLPWLVPVPPCICASCFKIHVLRRRCYRRWNTASGWRRLGQWRIMNSHASIPGRLLQAPGVYSMIVWLQLSPAVCGVSCVQLTTRFVVVATNAAENCVALFDGDMCHKK